MWEPFSKGARLAVVHAQEIAQTFASNHIGTEHIAFALAEGDGEVAQLLAGALDREAIKERLGTAGAPPTTEMVFTGGAKRTIELAFVNARKLDHSYIGIAHLALGLLDSGDLPPLLPSADPAALRVTLETAAKQQTR